MKIKLFVIAFASLLCAACSKSDNDSEEEKTGQLVSVTENIVMSPEEVAHSICSQIKPIAEFEDVVATLVCEVRVVSILYTTTGVDGDVVTASGIITYPTSLTEYDKIVSVQHSTCDINEAPSTIGFPMEAAPAVNGDVVVMADYLGYGSTEQPNLVHPYMQASLTGTTCADMFSAAEQYLEQTDLVCNDDKIVLMGYSQGGAATISTLLEMESRGMKDRIDDVWAGAGPYDLVRFFNRFTASPDQTFSRNGYIPFIIRGLNYGEHLGLNYHNMYAQRIFDNGYDKLFDDTQVSVLHSILGDTISKVIHQDFYAASSEYNGNEDIKRFFVALDKNSLIETAPQTPVKLYHCPGDDIVPYECSVLAKEAWPNSTLTDLTFSNHFMSGAEFLLTYMGWFDFLEPFLLEDGE